MTRKEQLQFCKHCLNRKYDERVGYICSLTNNMADFEEKCDSYVFDKIAGSTFNPDGTVCQVDIGLRFVNYLLDQFFCVLIVLIFAMLGAWIGITPKLIYLLYYINTMSGLQEYFVSSIFLLIYYLVFEGINGRTIGKYITGTKVVTLNDQEADLNTILQRTLCRFIPFNALSFLGKRGWHDRISETKVIKVK